jgi:hypothetical protein
LFFYGVLPIFNEVRTHTSIFSAAFILIFGFLHLQTLTIDYKGMMKENTCAKTQKTNCTKPVKPVCAKSKCPLPVSSDEKEDCNSNGCNPFVPCNMGFCCYLVESIFTYSHISSLVKNKLVSQNDNRLSGSLSECWHPPELAI